MASFVIHTIAGEIFLNNLEETYNIKISSQNKNLFLLGNLIVDSISTDKSIPVNLDEKELKKYKIELKNKIRTEKIKTHFRDIEKENLCIKSPELDLFVNKYYDLLIKEFSVLGYLFHLFTDKLFFTFLFPLTFENLDINNNLTIFDNDSVWIRIKKNDKKINTKDFWAGNNEINIYNDYTTLNKILLENYSTSFDAHSLKEFANKYFINPGIEEVDYNKIINLIETTDNYIKESYKFSKKELNVFDEKVIKEFIFKTSKDFMLQYNSIIKKLLEI